MKTGIEITNGLEGSTGVFSITIDVNKKNIFTMHSSRAYEGDDLSEMRSDFLDYFNRIKDICMAAEVNILPYMYFNRTRYYRAWCEYAQAEEILQAIKGENFPYIRKMEENLPEYTPKEIQEIELHGNILENEKVLTNFIPSVEGVKDLNLQNLRFYRKDHEGNGSFSKKTKDAEEIIEYDYQSYFSEICYEDADYYSMVRTVNDEWFFFPFLDGLIDFGSYSSEPEEVILPNKPEEVQIIEISDLPHSVRPKRRHMGATR